MMEERTFALRLEYDGASFGGSQLQANARTVQGELERALEPLAGGPRRVALAGRTDAGVHATGQVAAVSLPAKWEAGPLQRALNARLPEDLAVTAAVEAPASFDPRRRAVSRRYEYWVLNDSVRSPLARRTMWHVQHPLEDEAIAAAVAMLEGEHAFAAFAGPVEAGASTVRRMLEARICREGRLLRFEFEATAFLPHQVRRTVGALVELGRGKLSPAEFEALLRSARPGTAGPAAPAHGLCLVRVEYREIRFDAAGAGGRAEVEDDAMDEG